jgi:tetratricopeptide (TPR) repeat protein
MNQIESVCILNVGTKLLTKDLMDQYIRSLGHYSAYKTYYAPNFNHAIRSLNENDISIIISELEFEGGTFFKLLKSINWNPDYSKQYIILALEEKITPQMQALIYELEIQATLIKPFTALDLKRELERYQLIKSQPLQPWQALLKEAYRAHEERRYTDVDLNFKEAIKASPDNPIPLLRAALYFIKQKNEYAVSEKLLLRALELNPNLPQVLSALGFLYLRKKEYEKSFEYYQKANKISPLNSERMLEMVKLFIDWSIELCQTASRVSFGDAMAKLNLGKLLSVSGDYAGAIKALSNILNDIPREKVTEAQTFSALARKLGGFGK